MGESWQQRVGSRPRAHVHERQVDEGPLHHLADLYILIDDLRKEALSPLFPVKTADTPLGDRATTTTGIPGVLATRR